MLPRADIIAITPVGRADPVSRLDGVADPRQEAFQRSLAGLVGKSLQAEVLSKLTDGSYIVKVAGASARMLLPQGVKVGADVPLTLISLEPRPTFQVATGANGQVALAYAHAGPALTPRNAPASAAPGVPAPPLPAGAEELPDALPARAAPPLPLPGQPAATPLRLPEIALGAALQAALAPPGPPKTGAETAPARAGETLTHAHAAALLGKAPLVPAAQLPPIDPTSTPSQLSDTARVLANVLGSNLQNSTPAPIVARTPLVAGPAAPPEQVAAALREAVGKSGLFYESHVAEWSDGKRPLAELAREPQMQRALAEAAPRPPGAPPDPASAQMINQQLATHEQARVSWQGQAWPGQPMQWEVHRDAPEGRGGDGGEAPEPAWRSGVRFSFPLLGDIAASVVLVGDQLHIQVRAGTEAAPLLRQHAASLGEALAAAGIPLSSLDIQAGQETGHG
jgi:hypothetical protein